MKFFERINQHFVNSPFLLYLFIFLFTFIPLFVNYIKEEDKKMADEKEQVEKQKVCVITKPIIKPDLTYEIKVCSNESIELVSINGNPVAKENN